jgi:hypothetical protein
MKYVFLICLIFSGCSHIAVKCTPTEVKNAIQKGDVVAEHFFKNPPQSTEEMIRYHEVNAKLWRELAIFFEVRK